MINHCSLLSLLCCCHCCHCCLLSLLSLRQPLVMQNRSAAVQQGVDDGFAAVALLHVLPVSNGEQLKMSWLFC